MNEKTLKVLKIGVAVLGVGVTLATKFFEGKELDTKVAKAVAEAMEKK